MAKCVFSRLAQLKMAKFLEIGHLDLAGSGLAWRFGAFFKTVIPQSQKLAKMKAKVMLMVYCVIWLSQ